MVARLTVFLAIAGVGWMLGGLQQVSRYYRRGLSDREWLGAMRNSRSFLRDWSWLVRFGIRAYFIWFALRAALPEILGV